MQTTQLIPISKAVGRIGLKSGALYLRIRAGQLQAVKVGNRTFLDEAEIARFLAANARIIGRRNQPGPTDKAS